LPLMSTIPGLPRPRIAKIGNNHPAWIAPARSTEQLLKMSDIASAIALLILSMRWPIRLKGGRRETAKK